MRLLRHIVHLLAALLLLAGCDIEKLVDTPVGNWEVTRAGMYIKMADGTVIKGSTIKELKDGLLQALEPQLKKLPYVDIDELMAYEEGEDEEKPLVPEGSARMEFREDETLLLWTQEDEHWQVSGSGEWSYAEGHMVLYLDSGIYHCIVEKLTNKRLWMNVSLPDISTLFSNLGNLELLGTRAEEDPAIDMEALSELLSVLMGMQMSVDVQLAHL